MVVVAGHTDPTTGRILFTQALKAFKIGEILSKNGFKGFSPRIYVPPDMPVAMDTAYGIVMGLGGIKHVQISNRTGPRASIQRLPFIAWDAHPGEIQLVIEDADNARGMACVQQRYRFQIGASERKIWATQKEKPVL